MLTANFDEIPDFTIRILNARAAVGDVDEYALGSFVIFAFDCSTNAKHKVGSLFLDFGVKNKLLLLGHFCDLGCAFEGDQTVN